jgi:hypothetical protein
MSNPNEKNALFEQYEEEIRQFFKGTTYFECRGGNKIWVATHGLFDTLTVEPITGGQYELAVRLKNHKGEWCGYVARNGYIVGINTGGH